MKSYSHLLLFIGVLLSSFSYAQSATRTVIRTNAQGNIIRFTVDENRTVVRKQVIGQVTEAVKESAEPAQVVYQPEYSAAPESEGSSTRAMHLIGINISGFMQNGSGLSMLSTRLDPKDINTVYAGILPLWKVGNTVFGTSLGFNYTYVFPINLTIITSFHFEYMGWALGGIDFGIGGRIPLSSIATMLLETSFTVSFTSADLPIIEGGVVLPGNPDSISTFLTFLGFKGRLAFEFSLPKNMYIATGLSYAVYPWVLSSAEGEFRINNNAPGKSIAMDMLSIGVDIGWKLPGK